jgi:hypothetical protein
MQSQEAVKLLVFSGTFAILFSSIFGFVMLIPLQPWGKEFFLKINWKQIGHAHLDWIILGLMQGLAGGLIAVFGLSPSFWAVWAIVVGGWMNALPYLFRGLGINAFSLSGGFLQIVTALMGLFSSCAIVYGLSVVCAEAWGVWK